MKNDKLRVGIYLRLSDEDKNKVCKFDNSESIKNQRNLLISEINKRDDFVLVDEYCDEDLSGAGTYRPEFERLINDCEMGKLDVVLCKSQSRFSRDMEIIEKYLHNKFIEWNVRFISFSDHADTFNIGNKKARQINGLVNEWYLEDVSNNIRSAFYIKMKNGELISPFAPFGYEISKLDNNKLVVDKEASLIVRKIFFLYLNGYGYSSIAKYLNHFMIPSPSYYKFLKGCKLNINSKRGVNKIFWCGSAVKAILMNEVYIGNLIQGKRTTVSYKNHKIIKRDASEWIRSYNTHEAIISKDIFYDVQKLIRGRMRKINNNKIHHIFSSKVYCLECNSIMRKKNSGKHEYLVCSCYENGSCNNGVSIRYDVLEKIILEKVNKMLDIYFEKDMFFKLYNSSDDLEEIKNFLLITQKKIFDIDIYIKNLYEDKVKEIIDVEQFKKLVLEYKKEKDFLNNRLHRLEMKINYLKNEKEKSYEMFGKHFLVCNNVIVNEFIKNIFIGSLDKINRRRVLSIYWNF